MKSESENFSLDFLIEGEEEVLMTHGKTVGQEVNMENEKIYPTSSATGT